jgi:hypothetical protein
MLHHTPKIIITAMAGARATHRIDNNNQSRDIHYYMPKISIITATT